ncbi:MAG: MerC domain-containing protein [Blastocatellia bacterium]
MPTVKDIAVQDRLDHIGIVASSLCAIHCVLTPFIIFLIPVAAAGRIASPRAEWAFLAASLAIGALSLLPSYFRRHRRIAAIRLFAIGLCLILLGRLVLESYVVFETFVVVAGALFIATGHGVNRHFCRACNSCSLAKQSEANMAEAYIPSEARNSDSQSY